MMRCLFSASVFFFCFWAWSRLLIVSSMVHPVISMPMHITMAAPCDQISGNPFGNLLVRERKPGSVLSLCSLLVSGKVLEDSTNIKGNFGSSFLFLLSPESHFFQVFVLFLKNGQKTLYLSPLKISPKNSMNLRKKASILLYTLFVTTFMIAFFAAFQNDIRSMLVRSGDKGV